jgi:hypothetical protein
MASSEMVQASRHLQLPSTWENNHRYGIVHHSECNICDRYKTHVADAALDNDTSFQIARDELKRQHETFYSNGIAEGRRQQQLIDEAELHAARQEIAMIRARLEVAQMEYDQPRPREADAAVGRQSWSSVVKLSKSFSAAREAHRGDVACGQIGPVDQLPSPVASSLSETSFATPASGTEKLEELQGSPATGSLGIEHQTYTSSVDTPLPHTPPWERSVSAQPYIQNLNTTETADTDQTTESPAAEPWQTVGETHIKTPRFIKQMDKLLKEAHIPGNIEHYKKVKLLCTEAHLAKEQKTDLQRYLLVKWKTPDWVKGSQSSSSNSVRTAPGPPTNPLYDDPPEVWVAYYAAFPASCPLGVRRDTDGIPFLSDMRASRIMARLRPDMVLDEQTTRAARMAFKEIAIRHLFSVPGRYHRVLTNKKIVIAPKVTYQHFMGQPGDITLERVAIHFAICGISFAVADSDLEPWAAECVARWAEAGRV